MNICWVVAPLKHRSLLHFCSHADHRRRSSDHHYRSAVFFSFKRGFFFFPHKCNMKPSESVAIKGIWMSQRRLLAQRSDVTLETPGNMAFKSRGRGWRRLRLTLLCDMKTTIEFPQCDCGSNGAETPGGRSLLHPASKRSISASSPSANRAT